MNPQAAHLDFETQSTTNLLTQGMYRYAEDPNTSPLGFRYRIGLSGPIGEWRPFWRDPVDLLDHVANGGMVTAHNAAFERAIWNRVIRPRYCPHWPELRVEQQDCTMARAAAIALPQALEKLGPALHMRVQKDLAGQAIMKKLAKPRSVNADGSITWWNTPEDVDRVMVYCGTDVETETEADTLLPPLSEYQRADWMFDQIINERGVFFDLPAARMCEELTAYAKKQNDKLIRKLTQRAAPKCSNDKKIIKWLQERRLPVDSLAAGNKNENEFWIDTMGDSVAEQVVALRNASMKTSTAKYRKMQMCANNDGRIRGLINWHGASTGRRAGRLVQPQNFKRVDPDDTFLQTKISWLHELAHQFNSGKLTIAAVYDLISQVHGPLEVIELLSCALRSMICAKDGHKLVSGDFSNVEGRLNAWFADEHWKLQAFEAYDAGRGPDLYKLAYARSFGVDVETIGKGRERQIGKVQELALGYQGGVGAYIGMGANYGVNPYHLVEPVQQASAAQQWDATAARYLSAKNKSGLTCEAWTALQILVDNWRAANPGITQSWWDYQDAAVEAMKAPGTIVGCSRGRVRYYFDGRCLWCVLPTERMLCYPDAWLEQDTFEYVCKMTGALKQSTKSVVKFMGMDSVTHKWCAQSLYGGLQCNNIVQGSAVDLLVHAMFKVEQAGYPVILTVHDEIVTEVPEYRTDLNDQHFAELMSDKPAVFDGLPLSVGAWQDKRYVK